MPGHNCEENKTRNSFFIGRMKGIQTLEKLLKKDYKRQKSVNQDTPPVLTRYDNVAVGEISCPIPSYFLHTPPDLIKLTPPSKASIFLMSFLHPTWFLKLPYNPFAPIFIICFKSIKNNAIFQKEGNFRI